METLTHVLEKIQTAVWDPLLSFFLWEQDFILQFKLGGCRLTKFPKALKCIFEKEDGVGDVSSFATLCTTLAACIGTGSIVGVATALRIGGPGALFWMWVSALLGMTTKYAEGLLAIKYRVKDENGEIAGGPMYYIQNGLGDKFKWLAKLFAFFGAVTALLGSGTFPQVNAITESVNASFHLPVLLVGAIITIMTAVVTLGGIKSISKVAEFIVPFMALFFVGGSVLILVWNYKVIPATFGHIFACAFSKESVLGGAAGTAVISFMTAMRMGVARGVYTNEAGLGSSPIVAAAAKTNSCVKQGLISMTSVFFTTIVVCTMTGLVVISSGLLDNSELSGSILVTAAYNAGLPINIGTYLISFGLIFFAFTTILGWNYYGERCVLYLTGTTKSIKPFKIIYIFAIAIAPFMTLEPIWMLADITNALMVIPNLIALLGLRKVVISETKKYFNQKDSLTIPEISETPECFQEFD